MYSPRRSTHSLQWWIGVVNGRFLVGVVWTAGYRSRPACKDALRGMRIRPSGSFRAVEEFAQLLAQRKPGAVQAAFHRRDREIERVRDVLVRQPVDVLEQEHRPVVVRKVCDRSVDRCAQFARHHLFVRALRPIAAAGRLQVALGREPGARQLERLLSERIGRPPLAPQAHERAVRCDPVQPAGKLGFAAEQRKLLVRVQEGLLEHLLRVRLRSGHPQREPVELALVPLDEHGEGGSIALLRALHQLPVPGLSVKAGLLRGRFALCLVQVGQGPGTLKQGGGVVKSHTSRTRAAKVRICRCVLPRLVSGSWREPAPCVRDGFRLGRSERSPCEKDYAGGRIFPGFSRLSGSNARLRRRCSSITSRLCSASSCAATTSRAPASVQSSPDLASSSMTLSPCPSCSTISAPPTSSGNLNGARGLTARIAGPSSSSQARGSRPAPKIFCTASAAASSSGKKARSVATDRGNGITFNVAWTITASVPSLPTRSCVRSYPATPFQLRCPVRISSPVGSTACSAST